MQNVVGRAGGVMLAEHYLLIKNIHIGLALLSGSLFVARGLWVLLAGSGAPWQRRVNRISYMVDTGRLPAIDIKFR